MMKMISSIGSSKATTRTPLSTISLPTKPTRKYTTKKSKQGAAVSCSSCLIPKSADDESNEDDTQDFSSNKRKSNGNIPTNSVVQQPSNTFLGMNKPFDSVSKNFANNLGSSGSNSQSSQPSTGGKTFPTQGNSISKTPQQQQGRISPSSNQPNFIAGDNKNYLSNARKNPSQGQQPISGKRNQVSTPSLNGEPPLGKSVGEGSGGILYKFNYTVGYHGHHEQGDYDGIKDGGYHFVGRDGLRRTIDYLANEFGYQPYLKLEPADDKDVPKEETEKEAGLKGYEFKWFNKPK